MVFGWDPQREREKREREKASSDLEFVYPGRPAADLSFEHGGCPAVVDDGGDPVLTILGGNGSVDEQKMGRWGNAILADAVTSAGCDRPLHLGR